MSFSPSATLGYKNMPGPFLYNPQGLRKFVRSLWQAQAGNGGIDVVAIGDSITDGSLATNATWTSWAPQLRTLLQSYYNPGGKTGGLGFWHWSNGGSWYSYSGSYASSGTFTTPTYTIGTASNDGIGAIKMTFGPNSAGNTGLSYRVDVLGAGYLPQTVNTMAYEAVSQALAAVTPLYGYEINAGTPGLIDGSYTVNTVPGTTTYGYRQPHVNLVTTQQNRITVGTTDTVNVYYPDGLLYYGNATNNFDDSYQGIRLHKIGVGGQKASNYTANAIAATITNFGTLAEGAVYSSGISSINAKLFIFGHITNDAATTGFNAATFKTSYQSLITAALGCASNPSVILLIPMMPLIGTWPGTLANWMTLRSIIYDLADTNNCTVIDVWEAINTIPGLGGANGLWPGTWTTLGFNGSDGIHPTQAGHNFIASLFVQTLIDYAPSLN